MSTWEYQVLRFPVENEVKFDHIGITKTLNEWGQHGWELVSTETIAKMPSGNLYFIATLKRPLIS